MLLITSVVPTTIMGMYLVTENPGYLLLEIASLWVIVIMWLSFTKWVQLWDKCEAMYYMAIALPYEQVAKILNLEFDTTTLDADIVKQFEEKLPEYLEIMMELDPKWNQRDDYDKIIYLTHLVPWWWYVERIYKGEDIPVITLDI